MILSSLCFFIVFFSLIEKQIYELFLSSYSGFSFFWVLKIMSSAMDKALMAMSLEEEEIPFDMPELPEFSSCERNILSVVGRLLNPECQSMKNLIRDIPRKWQKIGRVRGVALSLEKFQFIFNSEHDLVEVLEKGVHTYNEWVILVERWVEHPPDNYLQFMPVWIQIWNLPINYYTEVAITALGELIGQVLEVAFDPNLPQIQGFVRVKVLFDVSRPLRRSKLVNLPKGGSTTVKFEFERVQKRCYECQRLTHERDACPFFIKKIQELSMARRQGFQVEKTRIPLILKESDPLHGVLEEEQVCVDPMTGRPRIAADVLEGMRQYIRVSNEEERKLRIDKVKKSVKEVEKDPIAQKTIVRLEPLPIIHPDINKGKGLVFGYEDHQLNHNKDVTSFSEESPNIPRFPVSKDFGEFGPSTGREDALMRDKRSFSQPAFWGSSSNWDGNSSAPRLKGLSQFDNAPEDFLGLSLPSQDSFTVYRTGFDETSASGTIKKKAKPRKRQTKNARRLNQIGLGVGNETPTLKMGLEIGVQSKRKAVAEMSSSSKLPKLKAKEVIPLEGSPNV